MQADARTRDSGTTLTIDTSIPAHLNGTAFRKLRSPPVQNQHSNSDLHQSAAWYHGEPSAATHLSSEPAQKKQRPTKLEMWDVLTVEMLQASERWFQGLSGTLSRFRGRLEVASQRGHGNLEIRGAWTSSCHRKIAFMGRVIFLQNSDFNYDKHTN
jgi:hypothetical protein